MRRFAVDFVTTSAEIAKLNKDELEGPMSGTTPAAFPLCLCPPRRLGIQPRIKHGFSTADDSITQRMMPVRRLQQAKLVVNR